MTRRVPKRGFNNKGFSIRFQIVNVGDIEKMDPTGKDIDSRWLYDNGLIHSNERPVKVLGKGELTKRVSVRAHCFSKSAREKIEKMKGKAEVITRA